MTCLLLAALPPPAPACRRRPRSASTRGRASSSMASLDQATDQCRGVAAEDALREIVEHVVLAPAADARRVAEVRSRWLRSTTRAPRDAPARWPRASVGAPRAAELAMHVQHRRAGLVPEHAGSRAAAGERDFLACGTCRTWRRTSRTWGAWRFRPSDGVNATAVEVRQGLFRGNPAASSVFRNADAPRDPRPRDPARKSCPSPRASSPRPPHPDGTLSARSRQSNQSSSEVNQPSCP